MKSSILAAALLAGIAVAAPSLAQTARADDTGWRLPHERGFWGHAGISAGRSKLDADCPVGFTCDDKDQAFRLFAGGRFNNAVGLEAGLMNFGSFARGGGDTDGWGVDLALVAGFPIGRNSAVFGKLGAVYGRMEVEGSSVGRQTGKERGFGPRYGIGAQVGLTENWALRADYDRYRLSFPGTKEDLDTFLVGVQYTFK
jgi:opacity protein-like surface antigen